LETAFTPWQSLSGGGLIGLAAVLLMLTLGRVLGATGILSGFLRPTSRADWQWRAALIAGMVSAPPILLLTTGQMPQVQVPVGTPAVIIGGLLVGVGVTFGGGCTSGHGICGLARLSPRSFAAVITFMLSAFLTVHVIRHVIGG